MIAAGSDSTTRVDRCVFYVLATILAARPLISETYERLELSFIGDAADIGPSPAATAWLDLFMLAAAMVAFVTRGLDWPRLRWAWIGIGLLALAAIISTIAAAEKRIAANAAFTMLSYALAGIALLRVGQAAWMGRLLIAAIVASAAMNAVKCTQQKTYEFAETLDAWRAQQNQSSEAGQELDDPAMVNYERRLLSGNTFGWLAHPNLTASILAMGATVAIALATAAAMIWHRRAPAWPLFAASTVAGALIFAIITTGSNGALLALLAGAVVSAIAMYCRTDSSRRRFAILILTGYALFVAAIAAYGLAKGTLPGASLAFRWEYWTAAARSIGDAGVTGVGRENFGAAYLLHKAPAATEEVQNPHSLWLSLLIEMGPIGLAAGVLLMIVAVVGGARSSGNLGGVGVSPATSARTTAKPEQKWRGFGPIAISVFMLHAIVSGIPLQPPFPAVAIVWIAEFAIVWLAIFAICCVLLRTIAASGEYARYLSAGCLGAIVAALVHNLIDFSLLTPAGLAAFVGLLCSSRLISKIEHAEAPIHTPVRLAVSAAAFLALAFSLLAIVMPTTSAQSLLASAMQTLRTARTPSDISAFHARGLAATLADSLDSSISRTLGQAMLQSAAAPGTPADWRKLWLTQAEDFSKIATTRNDRSVSNARLAARIADAQATFTPANAKQGRIIAAKNAAAAWTRVTQLYPTSPRDHLAAARAAVTLWRIEPSDETAIGAAEHIHKCLSIDNTRDAANAVKLRPRERAEIESLLATLAAASK